MRCGNLSCETISPVGAQSFRPFRFFVPHVEGRGGRAIAVEDRSQRATSNLRPLQPLSYYRVSTDPDGVRHIAVGRSALVGANFLPGWTVTAQQTNALAQAGFNALQNAFNLRAQANAGAAAAVNTTRPDGGLAPSFQAYYAFLPRTPLGYAWTYGYTTQSQLTVDGYAGNATGGLRFCLYPPSGGGSQGIYQGLNRAGALFPNTQYYLNANGPSFCGRAIGTGAPLTYPAPVIVTFFVRYVAGN